MNDSYEINPYYSTLTNLMNYIGLNTMTKYQG